MKSLSIILTAAALITLPAAGFAAELVAQAPHNQQSIGVVSANGVNNLDSLQAQLSAKADEAGAKSFRITSTTGNNKLHGTAEIFQ
ncbi:hypothetical protein BTJ39_13845 [Izhakiella australiensis]|uniref:YdgH/BhsA/McbA-like domain-containing protein n=1 Tax=Izhakiella australiensis TaxID=1926881 RepID=A0A1S8YJV8_9GAMM|nr:DUF1471 domain-containing protein [Izhakiella australiensis]OON39359.1 hypothetical protein BTJ39_13845 [Izhakiella australiensis]